MKLLKELKELIKMFLIFFGVGAVAALLVIMIVDKCPEIITQYQVTTLEGGTFDLDVIVLVTEDTAFALRYVKKHLDSTASSDNFDSRGTTFTSINGGSTIVWLPNTEDKSIVMHELLHATIDIMRRTGVPLTEETEEAYAYELQYLTNQFYKQNKTN